MGIPMSDELCREAVEAYRKYGSKTAAANALGIFRSTMSNRLHNAQRRGFITLEEMVKPGIHKSAEILAKETANAAAIQHSIKQDRPEMTVDDRLRERRLETEVNNLRKREKELLDRLAKSEEYRASVMDLVGERLDPRGLSVEASSRSRAETVILVLSDLHFGEHINAEELDGLNSFDPQIAEARLTRVFTVAADLLTSHWPGPPPQRLIVALLGDMISGALHHELVRTDRMRPMESVRAVSGVLASGIDLLLDTVDCPIDVISVVGNHGRGSLTKPEAKGVAVDSYDTLVSDFLEMHFRGQSRLTFYVPPGPDALITIYGYRFLLTHGDRLGSGGGKGFVGAELPVLRGFQKVHMDYADRGMLLHHVICGHFHTPLASSRGTANGCLPGPSEYSTSFRLRPSQPMQAFIAVHPEHFITQTRWIKPGLPDEGSLYEAPVNASEMRPKYRVKAVSIP